MASARPPWSEESEAAWRQWWVETPKDEIFSKYTPPSFKEYVSDTASVFIALQEALLGVGCVSPNPLVGCIIRTNDNLFLSSGGHLQYGGAHAEINALSKLKQITDQSLVNQAKVLVTLEPCAHHGKTPPCVESLVKLPIGEVSYLVEDPNPLVKGKGQEFLEQRGIKANVLRRFADLGEEISRIFLFNQRLNKVYVGLKAATNKDGVYALKDSSKYWITSSRSREHGHFLRLEYDAILVGANTVRLDNPLLNIRSRFVSGRAPVRIVLDPKGVLDLSQNLFNSSDQTHVLLLTGVGAQTSKKINLEIISLPLNQQGHFDWEDVLGVLWSKGVRSVLIEGGGKVWKSALESKIVNRLHWYFGHADIIDDSNTLKISLPNLGENYKHKFEEDRYFEKDL